ncbi:TAXI family TRAP transporter solute-binding subunit [Indioceanicola profundi]|uniref:TAXI family TRAP transporter solute-binding subunit n=1 Tax=Indioceanicola profundi TaxID=2220096 RepID=UPI001CECDD44|nr:TAXI family TRAP transporter solute-binding subunit [Indioceanicola profundi]
MMLLTRRLFVAASAIAGLALATPAMAQKENWPKSFTIGTASQGGTYFQYGSGWADFIAQQLGITGSAEVTGGPAQNMALVHTGQLPFGMVTMGPARDALEGNSEIAPGMPMDNVRAIFPMYETPFSLVTLAASGVDDVSKLKNGARIGVGPAGGTSDAYFPAMLEALGAKIQKSNAGYSDLSGQLMDGLIEGIGFAAGVPIPAVSELESTTKINIISFTPEQLMTLTKTFPVSPYTIPASTYRTTEAQGKDIQAVSMWNFAVASADLPEDFVYQIVKLTMENNEKMVAIHKSAETTIPENYVHNKVLKWHPGAVRWFEENGHKIPAELKD